MKNLHMLQNIYMHADLNFNKPVRIIYTMNEGGEKIPSSYHTTY